MDKADVKIIMESAEFKALLKARRQLALPVVALIISAYFGFILLVAFKPAVLGHIVGNGQVSIGIYAGLGLLLLSFFLTAFYLRRSDGKIATLQKDIQDKFK